MPIMRWPRRRARNKVIGNMRKLVRKQEKEIAISEYEMGESKKEYPAIINSAVIENIFPHSLDDGPNAGLGDNEEKQRF
ncbi:hypothetical protein CEXT_405031 [Caerostris extrusa]|uniref:Uncharacterized protein n=1 Tax=Caerostris extrusa TaxID=172846 RepID=A0AAV4V994_CAEEX|nr:hypothetical protein CEXT_405031 [Caerostris extrusa]